MVLLVKGAVRPVFLILRGDFGVVTTGGVGCTCAARMPETSALALSISYVASE